MQTAELFAVSPIRAKAIRKGGVPWLRTHRLMVESWAAECGLKLSQVQAAILDDLGSALAESAFVADTTPAAKEITVVIPCHNYARFLPDCLASLAASTLQPVRVIIIDDASDVPLKLTDLGSTDYQFEIEIHRVHFRSQASACRYGFHHADVATIYCLFLDADDKVHPDYFATAVRMLTADREAACVFPLLEAFGEGTGCCHGVDQAPDVVTWRDLESRNWICAGSVWRSDILRQSLALKTDRVAGCGTNDWITARTVMRSGPWHALKTSVPLYYRQHDGQMHRGADFPQYHLQANLAREVVTIVVAFSGRWKQWWELREWIKLQAWPRDQTRLLILNSTHKPLTVEALELQHWSGAGLQIERIDAGFPQLADRDRRGRLDIQREVDSAVAGLYNRAIGMTYGEWMLFLEDDVIPQRLDTIEQLFQSVGPRVAAVSGVYRHRYDDSAVAFGPPNARLPMRPMDGPAVEHVTGTGFGCLLARRSVFSQFGLSGDDPRCWFFDVNAGVRVHRLGYQWILDRSVHCDHLV